MTQQETIRLILAQQNNAVAALHQSSDAFDRAIRDMRQAMTHIHGVMDAIAAANHAQGQAIDAVAAATAAALALVGGSPQ